MGGVGVVGGVGGEGISIDGQKDAIVTEADVGSLALALKTERIAFGAVAQSQGRDITGNNAVADLWLQTDSRNAQILVGIAGKASW